MSDELLHEVSCPNCRNPIDVRQHGKHVTCDACSSQFILKGHLCPHCSTYHEKETPFCNACGQGLNRVCRKCHTANWAGDEYCQRCGAALDILDYVTMQHTERTRQRLHAQAEQSHKLKTEADAAARERMNHFMKLEEERVAELRRQQAIRQSQERRLIAITLGLTGLFILGLVGFMLLRGG